MFPNLPTKQHNFIISNGDTDSLCIVKPDQEVFSEQEQDDLLAEINALLPEKIRFAHDGYFEKMIVFRAKNYILVKNGKTKQKGSAIKAPTLEPALKEFLDRVIASMLADRTDYTEIYNEYVKEISAISDINRWCTRKSITSKTMSSPRKNESNVRDAIAGSEIQENDRAYFFFLPDDSLCLAGNFKGEYNRSRLYEKLYKTCKRFELVLDLDTYFINYKLKRNTAKLTDLLGAQLNLF